jgi:hypothetical protein
MHRILVLCLLLVGCATTPDLPPQPVAPTDGEVVAKVGSEIDKSDSRVAAAITVANESADKPAVVKAETKVALAFLPPPSPGDLAIARARAASADAAAYKAAEDAGRRLLAKIDASWATMEADQREALRVSKLKDDRIAELVKEVEVAKKDGVVRSAMIGAGFCVLIALGLSLVGQYLRAAVAGLFGLGCAAVPFLFETPWFLPSLGGLILAGGIAAAVIAYRKTRTPTYDPPQS